ncbi:NlpC/P60 family protein [Geodermatophilus sp. SYSU D01105]
MPAPRTTAPRAGTTREAALRQAALRQAALRQASAAAAPPPSAGRARTTAARGQGTARPRTTASRRSAPPVGTTTRPPLTAQEAAALRAVLAARAAGTGPGTITPEPRPARRRPGTQPRRRTAAGRKTRRPRPPVDRRRWSVRLSLTALGLVLPVLAGVLAPGAQQAGTAAEPTDTAGLALAARSSMLDSAARYRSLERLLADRQAALQHAREAERAAGERLAAARQAVGGRAAALYRTTAEERAPLLELSVQEASTTSDVLYAQGLAELGQRDLETSVARADRAAADVAVAADRVATAEAAVAAVSRQAAAVLDEVRTSAAGLRPDVAARLAGLGAGPAVAAQQETNRQALQRWQDYLVQLSGAGIEPPSAAALADPASLPAGLSPTRDGSGQVVPGVAWAVVGNRPVTVLPAETIAAVSSALAQLGKPYVPGRSGPDAYDCGGLASGAWLLAGYALPTWPADQWAGGAAVPLSQLQVGDLVFADGGTDVGISLGEGQVVTASGAGYQVAVRTVSDAAGAVRVTLPAPAEPNGLLPAGTAGRAACGAPTAVGGVSPAWGGWTNGGIPTGALCSIARGHALRCDAAAGYAAMAEAFAAAFDRPLCITDSYRSLAGQVTAFRTKPQLAAVPGTSNHGWALAVDLCGGINVAGTPQSAWMAAHAGRFGFVQPDWARPGGEKPEPWHWEFGNLA